MPNNQSKIAARAPRLRLLVPSLIAVTILLPASTMSQSIERLAGTHYYCVRTQTKITLTRHAAPSSRTALLPRQLLNRLSSKKQAITQLLQHRLTFNRLGKLRRRLVILRRLMNAVKACVRSGPLSGTSSSPGSELPDEMGDEDTINTPTPPQITPAPNPGAPPPINIDDFETLSGASLLASDGTFLGIFSDDPITPNSIADPNGTYGRDYGPLSVFSDSSTYGSEDSDLSAFDENALHPPAIIMNGRFVAWFSLNQDLSPRVDPIEVIIWILGLADGEE